MGAQEVHPIGKRIADRIAERQPGACLLVLDNTKLEAFSRQGSSTPPFDLMQRESSAPKAAWKRVQPAAADGDSGSSSGGGLGLSPASSSWEQLRARFLNLHAKGVHARLADFDEHLDDVSRDYTNQQLFSGDTALLTR